MKKTLGLLTIVFFLGVGCTKTSVTEEGSDIGEKVATAGPGITLRTCASQEVLIRQLKEDPSLQGRMNDIERVASNVARNPSAFRLLSTGIIEIPVVVNVLYQTSAQNISLSQIQSQIKVLNDDYSGANADISRVPAIFSGVKAGDVGIRFVLDTVIRKSTKKSSFSTNDAMKKSAGGGINPTSPSTKLNMWSCNMGGGILGYAQFPGGNLATDGVVIDDNAFGVTTTNGAYSNGRTATHEIGHWLNLRHIWGDANCGNDFIDDTPLHNGANYGCPPSGAKSTCTGSPVMMTMNYMDYTDDLCMYMFSAGQKTRMDATFVTGGGRTTFAQP